MFRGATKITLDDKGRMVMPSRYREQIAEHAQGKLVVTVDRDKCLLIYPQPEWELLETKPMSMANLHTQARLMQQMMVGFATDLELDGHGRMLLPPELRQFAGLERLAMLVGQGNRFELWNESRWSERLEEWLQSKEASELPSELATLSL